MIPMSLRTEESERAYGEMKAAGKLKQLKDEPSLREWTFWRLIENRFPYNVCLRTHHMLLPIRVVSDKFWLTPEEYTELDEILEWAKNEYDFVLENFPKRRSILTHFHLHLGNYYDNRSEMKL